MTTETRSRYTAAKLDELSGQGDPFADETVAAMFERGEVGDFNTLMRFFSTAGHKLPEGLPPSAVAFLEATAMPPKWVDWDVMERARLFFMDNAAHINTGLSFAAMPATYAVPRVARLLASTHSMDYPSRRMANTGQFVTYLMRTNAFEEGSKFIPAAQKVRLLHAAVRHHLTGSGRWDVARDGVPINQEDMIGGQICFSILVLDAMHRLGIHMSEEGAEAYYYAWRVVGSILGCDMTAVPDNLTEARAFADLYLSRNLGPSEDGVRLNNQLMRMYEDVVPGTLFDPIVPATMRYLIGPTIADWLEIPRGPWDTAAKAVPLVLGLLETVEDSSPLGEWALDKAGSLLTAFELASLTRGRVMQYAIPEELKGEYGVRSQAPRTNRWVPPVPSPA
ncbi:oxygenase MpaB family protein [Streptomyces antarcticus]|uniref:oxygenase MpaB family protein n=1 Tax=Streptomyces antarcticus TaxID=2996458 RepID=UPI00226EAF2D|nr:MULTISPECIES: oxygenase MpaB family protein [unclassified Streptomyces]MCY0946872.1 oxygenase MpaB family protein [Streptomyces sp. H34-AA3]MCZ4085628.1 oxygenase MpaB family protein [Streptomyces sp. H34-S5]